jgi:hypothetical protein
VSSSFLLFLATLMICLLNKPKWCAEGLAGYDAPRGQMSCLQGPSIRVNVTSWGFQSQSETLREVGIGGLSLTANQLALCQISCIPETESPAESQRFEYPYSISNPFINSSILQLLFTLQFIHPSIHPSIYLSTHSPVNTPIHSFIHSFIHPSIHPFHSSTNSSIHSLSPTNSSTLWWGSARSSLGHLGWLV